MNFLIKFTTKKIISQILQKIYKKGLTSGYGSVIIRIQNKCLHAAFRVLIERNVGKNRGEHELLKTAQCAVLSGEVSERITLARTVTETAVALTAVEHFRRESHISFLSAEISFMAVSMREWNNISPKGAFFALSAL